MLRSDLFVQALIKLLISSVCCGNSTGVHAFNAELLLETKSTVVVVNTAVRAKLLYGCRDSSSHISKQLYISVSMWSSDLIKLVDPPLETAEKLVRHS